MVIFHRENSGFKSLVASKPVYVATMISVPQKFCDALKSLHRESIWNGKNAKMKHSSLIGEYRHLGVKEVDIDAKILSLKISWVRQLKDSNFHPYKVLVSRLLSPVGGEAIFHTNLCLSENQRLYHMNLVQSPLCSLCKREIDSISHLFLKCEFSTRLWAETQRWCSPAIALRDNKRRVLGQTTTFVVHRCS